MKQFKILVLHTIALLFITPFSACNQNKENIESCPIHSSWAIREFTRYNDSCQHANALLHGRKKVSFTPTSIPMGACTCNALYVPNEYVKTFKCDSY